METPISSAPALLLKMTEQHPCQSNNLVTFFMNGIAYGIMATGMAFL